MATDPSASQPGEAPSECDFCGGDDFTPPSAHAFDRGNVYCIRCGGLHWRNYAFAPPAAREPETCNRYLGDFGYCDREQGHDGDCEQRTAPADRTAEYAALLLAAVQAVRDCPCMAGASCDALDRLYDLAADIRAALATEAR